MSKQATLAPTAIPLDPDIDGAPATRVLVRAVKGSRPPNQC